jgi:hypothetical protein
VKPEAVSFHFGLPDEKVVQAIKSAGIFIVSSATTVAEARMLEQRGVDAVIAQGTEAGGHRATFSGVDISMQVGLFSLLPQVVDAVSVPVIAAGGVSFGSSRQWAGAKLLKLMLRDEAGLRKRKAKPIHLGTDATNPPELVRQLGERRFGHGSRVGDPFCGGGSIPFEAARLGYGVYAADLHPIACLLTWGTLNVVGGDDEATADRPGPASDRHRRRPADRRTRFRA